MLQPSNSESTPPQARTTHAPWGFFVVLDEGPGYKVKRLEVVPGKRLSYQRHAGRSEHWVIVQGSASVTLDGVTKSAHPGDAMYIPVGAAHRIGNAGSEPLVFIEVQRGSVLAESDIVRLEDDFNRA
jgi:mannose-6-phosphate isomerase